MSVFFARSSQVISANLLVMNCFECVFIVGILNLECGSKKGKVIPLQARCGPEGG